MYRRLRAHTQCKHASLGGTRASRPPPRPSSRAPPRPQCRRCRRCHPRTPRTSSGARTLSASVRARGQPAPFTVATRRGRIARGDGGGRRELAALNEARLGHLQTARAHARANGTVLRGREASERRRGAEGNSEGKARLCGQEGRAHQCWAGWKSTHDDRRLGRREDGRVRVEAQRVGLVFTACAADQGTSEHAAMTFWSHEFEGSRAAT